MHLPPDLEEGAANERNRSETCMIRKHIMIPLLFPRFRYRKFSVLNNGLMHNHLFRIEGEAHVFR